MIETIESPRIERNPFGHPYLSVIVNGRPAALDYEQRLLRWGIVILSGDGWKGESWEAFQGEVAILPADPANGRESPSVVNSAAADARLVQLASDFRSILDTFEDIKSGPLYNSR